MIPKEAIERAIEGGWADFDPSTSIIYDTGYWQVIALDLRFWKCLGKALGWDADYKPGNRPLWHIQAFEFYDLVLNGYGPDEYWKELLK